MKKRVLTIGILLFGGFALLPHAVASAQETGVETNEDIAQQVAGNCQGIRNSLTQIHLRDALFRFNRAQSYEFITLRLMTPLNSRLLLNKVEASSLVRLTAQYDSTLNRFRTNYIKYDDQLASTIAIDCKKQPAEFYEALTKARQLREVVHQDVKQLNQYVTDYQKSVDDVQSGWSAGGVDGTHE